MAGFVAAEVMDPGDSRWRAGALVLGELGWQQHAAVPGGALSAVGPHRPLTHALSVLGVTGMTAWFGLLEVGRPRRGETIVVSMAGGATGHVAGQLARLIGCRAVGIVGPRPRPRPCSGSASTRVSCAMSRACWARGCMRRARMGSTSTSTPSAAPCSTRA
jgi:NADPH-dependent curcumin reductase CurA